MGLSTPSIGQPGTWTRLKNHFVADPQSTEPFDVEAGLLPADVKAPHVEATPQQLERALGAIGATAGSGIANKVGAVEGAIALGTLGSALGPAGTVIGGAAGAVLGYLAGRLGGALGGGALGVMVAKALSAAGQHVRLPQWLMTETQGFSMRELPHKALNIRYYSNAAPPGETEYQRVLDVIQPGDVLLSCKTVPRATFLKTVLHNIVGESGAWVHAAVYAGPDAELCGDGPLQPQVMEMFRAKAGHNPLEKFVKRNEAVMVLRPRYAEGSAEEVVQWMKDHQGVPYDLTFTPSRRDKMYCLSLVSHALEDAAPEITVQSKSALGKPIVTPGSFYESPEIDPVYSTGGHHGATFLKKFD